LIKATSEWINRKGRGKEWERKREVQYSASRKKTKRKKGQENLLKMMKNLRGTVAHEEKKAENLQGGSLRPILKNEGAKRGKEELPKKIVGKGGGNEDENAASL